MFGLPDDPLKLPVDWYAPRGTILLSPEALASARETIAQLWRREARGPCIATFVWTGDRLTLDGFLRHEIRTHTVQTFEGIPVIFLIPPEAIAGAKARRVVGEQGRFVLG